MRRREWRALRKEIERVQELRNIPGMFSQSAIVPPWGAQWASMAGTLVDRQTVSGLAAASVCIRLTSDTLASTPLIVYHGEDPATMSKAEDTWQWERLHDEPNEEQSAFSFWQDVDTSLEGDGNAFIWKAIARRPIQSPDDIQLFVIDPLTVSVGRDRQNRKRFKVGSRDWTDSSEVLHIRGWSHQPGSDRAISPITAHREMLGAALALEEFEHRWFTNDANPGGAIEIPGRMTNDEVQDMLNYWEGRHAGLANAHRPAVLQGGASYNPFHISLQDAQFIQSKQYSTEETARVFRISAVTLLGVYPQGNRSTVDEELHKFLQVDMLPRYETVRRGLMADVDLFPDVGGDEGLLLEYDPTALLRPDIQARFAAYKDAIQGGWLTPNEIREMENIPAHPLGDTLQVTPVGGAPNPVNPPAQMTDQQQTQGVEDMQPTRDLHLHTQVELRQADVYVSPAEVRVPDVIVHPPEVYVASPEVAVAPPEVHVEAPVVNLAPEIRVDVPAPQPTPIVVEAPHVEVQAPDVTVAPPNVTVEPPSISVEAPSVTVEPPNVTVEAPNVTVAPEIKPQVIVTEPRKRTRKTKLIRDEHGDAVGSESTEE